MSSVTPLSTSPLGGGASGSAEGSSTLAEVTPPYVILGPEVDKMREVLRVIESGKGPFYARPGWKKSFTPLHRAALFGDLETIEREVKSNPAKIVAQDVGGRTPLHYAAAAAQGLAMELLLNFEQLYNLNADLTLSDEYRGTAHDIRQLTIEREVPRVCGYALTNFSHISGEDLLKLWICVKPSRVFLKLQEEEAKMPPYEPAKLELFHDEACPELGTQVRALQAIAEEAFFSRYEGLFEGRNLNSPGYSCCFDMQGSVFPCEIREEESEYLEGCVDAVSFGSATSKINDGPPNARLQMKKGDKGLPLISFAVANRAIEAGDVIQVYYANHPVRTMTRYQLTNSEDLCRTLEEINRVFAEGKMLTATYPLEVMRWLLATPIVWVRLLEEGRLPPSHLRNLANCARQVAEEELRACHCEEPTLMALIAYLQELEGLLICLPPSSELLTSFCSWTRRTVEQVELIPIETQTRFGTLQTMYQQMKKVSRLSGAHLATFLAMNEPFVFVRERVLCYQSRPKTSAVVS